MIGKPFFSILCAAIFCIVLGAPASAQSFSVALGNNILGQLKYSDQGGRETLVSNLNNTPMGVFNGTFKGTSRGVAAGREFIGQSVSSRKTRTITTITKGGRAIQTTVTPTSEETKLSNVANVPAGLIDPVMAVGWLIQTGKGCPSTLHIYDGRRAIALTPTGQTAQNGMLTCDIAYTVFAGPGHLSPLKISKAKMQLNYAIDGTEQRLTHIRMGSGIFRLVLTRSG